MAELHPTPSPKMPEHLSTATPAKTQEQKIDKQVQDSFPASDPPAYAGGNHAIGAPVARESDAPSADAVEAAERKVRDGSAKQTDKY